MNTARSILISLLFFIFYFLFFISSASAQSQNPQVNPYLNPNTNPDVPKNLHTWTQNVMIEVMSAMTCQLAGIDPTDPKAQCLGVDPKTGNIGYVEGGGGAIGVAGKMIAMLYTPPLHSGDYFKYLADNFGIAKPAHAATGFEGLKPVQSLWIAFRNIVYLLFAIIFIVIGLAIMLRVRIDPRTVMTIQNQIPRIIIGILIVTFSFAIAGFLIDLMYVVIFLSYEVISSAVPTIDLSKLNPLNLQGQNALAAAGNIKEGGLFGIANAVALSLKELIGSFLNLNTSFLRSINLIDVIKNVGDIINDSGSTLDLLVDFISAFVGLQVGAHFSTITGQWSILGFSIPVGAIVGTAAGLTTFIATETLLRFAIPYLIVFLIVIVALFFALIRLWFVLIMAYVSILVDVVLAPFWIAASLLPGSPIGFGAWLRSIIANLAAFPATIIMFLLAKAFIDGFGSTPTSDQFVPPLIGNPGSTDAIGNLIGLGIIFMTDDVVRMLRSALKAPTAPLGAIGAAVGVGTGVAGSPFKFIAGAATGAFSLALAQRLQGRLPSWIPGGRGAASGGGAGGGPT